MNMNSRKLQEIRSDLKQSNHHHHQLTLLGLSVFAGVYVPSDLYLFLFIKWPIYLHGVSQILVGEITFGL